MMAIVHIDDAVAATVAALTAEPVSTISSTMIRCRLRSGFRLSPGGSMRRNRPRLSVDNAVKIAGEEAVHFHTSLSGVARAKA